MYMYRTTQSRTKRMRRRRQIILQPNDCNASPARVGARTEANSTAARRRRHMLSVAPAALHASYSRCEPNSYASSWMTYATGMVPGGATILPKLSVASCIVGLLESSHELGIGSSVNSRGTGISHASNYLALAQWAADLQRLNVSNDFFLRLDMRTGVRPRKAVNGNPGWTDFKTLKLKPEADLPDCNLNGTAAGRSVLDPVVAALKPVSVRTEPLMCYCARRDCSCTPGAPAWYEQMAKTRACFEDVVAYEHSRRSIAYDFVLKLRSDYDLARNGLTAAAFAATLHRSIFEQPRISIHPWGPCYINIDWAWVAPRSLAKVAFSIEKASCSWFRCIHEADAKGVAWNSTGWYRIKTEPTCRFSHGGDPILADWFLAHGAPFDAWVTQPSYESRARGVALGTGHNGGCQFDPQGMGLISPKTHATMHAGALQCGKDLRGVTSPR